MASQKDKKPLLPKSLTSPTDKHPKCKPPSSSTSKHPTPNYKTLPSSRNNSSTQVTSPTTSKTLPRKDKSSAVTSPTSKNLMIAARNTVEQLGHSYTLPGQASSESQTKLKSHHTHHTSTSSAGPGGSKVISAPPYASKDFSKTASDIASSAAQLTISGGNTTTNPHVVDTNLLTDTHPDSNLPPKCSCNGASTSKKSSAPAPDPAPTIQYKCCLRKCIQGELKPTQARVEVRGFVLKESEKQHMEVAWKADGEAMFHDICWKAMLDSYKMDNPFQVK